jgi:DNA-binding NarL/FixJ family response regulator
MSSRPEQKNRGVGRLNDDAVLRTVEAGPASEATVSPGPRAVRSAVVLDPFPLWLEAVEHVLRRIDFDVVGKTTSASEAVALVESFAADLLVAEIKTREVELDGLACIRRARERVPLLKVIMLSLYGSPEYIEAAFEAGASAYVLKTAEAEDFATTVRQSFEQSIYLEGGRPRLAPPPPQPQPHSEESGRLTRRELEILRLAAEGHKNAEMASMLWLTEQTIKFHLSNIYRKLNVSNRTEASRWAQVHGLLPRTSSRGVSS